MLRRALYFLLYGRPHYLHRFRRCSYIISHVKCGRTWVANVLDAYLNGGKVTGFRYAPKRMSPFRLNGEREVIFTHKFFDTDAYPASEHHDLSRSPYAGKPVAMLMRDPRDVVVSYYHHSKDRIEEFAGLSLSEFIRHPKGGIAAVAEFFNLQHQYAREASGAEFFYYRDLKGEGDYNFDQWLRLFEFVLGAEIDQQRLRAALEQNTVAKARQREQELTGKSKSSRVRKAKVGGYKDILSDDDVTYIDEYVAGHLTKT